MNRRRRDFLLLVMTVSAVSTPAWSQAISPGVPGSSRRHRGRGRCGTGRDRPDGVANFQQLVGDYTNPILQPRAAEVVKKQGGSLFGRPRLSDAEQPVLARRRALRVLGFPAANLPAAGPPRMPCRSGDK